MLNRNFCRSSHCCQLVCSRRQLRACRCRHHNNKLIEIFRGLCRRRFMKLADAELLRFGIDEFEPWARQWRCFCGSIHVQVSEKQCDHRRSSIKFKAGTTMIATILVILLQYTILRLLFMTRDQEPIVWRLVQIFMLTIDTIVVGALLYGCRRERHHYLLPYLVYSVSSCLSDICIIVGDDMIVVGSIGSYANVRRGTRSSCFHSSRRC